MAVEIRLTVRLPHTLHMAVTKDAKRRGQSVNDGIVARLSEALGVARAKQDENILQRLSDVEARLAKLEGKVSK